jgi:hypothetical protein
MKKREVVVGLFSVLALSCVRAPPTSYPYPPYPATRCYLKHPPIKPEISWIFPADGKCPVDNAISVCVSPKVFLDLAIYVVELEDYVLKAWIECDED